MSAEMTEELQVRNTVIAPRSSLRVNSARIKLLFSVVAYVAALAYGHDRYLAVEQAFWGVMSQIFPLALF